MYVAVLVRRLNITISKRPNCTEASKNIFSFGLLCQGHVMKSCILQFPWLLSVIYYSINWAAAYIQNIELMQIICHPGPSLLVWQNRALSYNRPYLYVFWIVCNEESFRAVKVSEGNSLHHRAFSGSLRAPFCIGIVISIFGSCQRPLGNTSNEVLDDLSRILQGPWDSKFQNLFFLVISFRQQFSKFINSIDMEISRPFHGYLWSSIGLKITGILIACLHSLALDFSLQPFKGLCL